MHLVPLGSALALGGVFLLRFGRDRDRRKVAAGWLLIGASLYCFGLAAGAERGAPTAFVVVSVFAWLVVGASAAWRPWRVKARQDETSLSPARHEGWARAASRWLGAGPLALIAATLAIVSIAALLGAASGDGVILSLLALVIAWASLAAWAFSSRRPLRTCAGIFTLALIGGAAIAAGVLT